MVLHWGFIIVLCHWQAGCADVAVDRPAWVCEARAAVPMCNLHPAHMATSFRESSCHKESTGVLRIGLLMSTGQSSCSLSNAVLFLCWMIFNERWHSKQRFTDFTPDHSQRYSHMPSHLTSNLCFSHHAPSRASANKPSHLPLPRFPNSLSWGLIAHHTSWWAGVAPKTQVFSPSLRHLRPPLSRAWCIHSAFTNTLSHTCTRTEF